MQRIILAIAASVFIFTSSLFAYTDEELVGILKDDGYTSVEIIKEGVLRIKVEGRTYALFRLKDGDLQAYYSISGIEVPCKKINTWNRARRLSRAYLDKDNDPVLESDLLYDGGGFSPKKIQAFFRIFIFSASKFREFISE